MLRSVSAHSFVNNGRNVFDAQSCFYCKHKGHIISECRRRSGRVYFVGQPHIELPNLIDGVRDEIILVPFSRALVQEGRLVTFLGAQLFAREGTPLVKSFKMNQAT